MQLDATQIIVALIALVGTVATSASLTKSAFTWLTNRGKRRRATIAEAEARADFEATRRRKFQEYASRLRRQMLESGIDDSEIPPWPKDTNYQSQEGDNTQ